MMTFVNITSAMKNIEHIEHWFEAWYACCTFTFANIFANHFQVKFYNEGMHNWVSTGVNYLHGCRVQRRRLRRWAIGIWFAEPRLQINLIDDYAVKFVILDYFISSFSFYLVCVRTVEEFAAGLIEEVKKDPKLIEEEFKKYCLDAKSKKQRFVSNDIGLIVCYQLGRPCSAELKLLLNTCWLRGWLLYLFGGCDVQVAIVDYNFSNVAKWNSNVYRCR